MAILLRDIRAQLEVPKSPMYAVFVDFSKAFDSIPRDMIIASLTQLGIPGGPVLRLTRDLLQSNCIRVDDGVQLSGIITQTSGILQGDTLSPLLFIAAISSLITALMEGPWDVELLMYADDLAIYSHRREDLQAALQRLSLWCTSSSLNVNTTKTKAVKFRRGGRLSSDDKLIYRGDQVEFVSSFKYLGVTIPYNLKGFAVHIEDRARQAIRAGYAVRNPRQLSISCALKLFDLKIRPIACYGIEHIWNALSVKSLSMLDKVKTLFLKRALGVSRFSRNRYVYLLCDTQPMCVEVISALDLPRTAAYTAQLADIERKQINVEQEFFETPAMQQTAWKEANCSTRHATTRFAVHGFHHVSCLRRHFHEPSEECRCRLCGNPHSKYHLLVCPQRNFSILYAASNTVT